MPLLDEKCREEKEIMERELLHKEVMRFRTEGWVSNHVPAAGYEVHG
jgi:hypothetical protein